MKSDNRSLIAYLRDIKPSDVTLVKILETTILGVVIYIAQYFNTFITILVRPNRIIAISGTRNAERYLLSSFSYLIMSSFLAILGYRFFAKFVYVTSIKELPIYLAHYAKDISYIFSLIYFALVSALLILLVYLVLHLYAKKYNASIYFKHFSIQTMTYAIGTSFNLFFIWIIILTIIKNTSFRLIILPLVQSKIANLMAGLYFVIPLLVIHFVYCWQHQEANGNRKIIIQNIIAPIAIVPHPVVWTQDKAHAAALSRAA